MPRTKWVCLTCLLIWATGLLTVLAHTSNASAYFFPDAFVRRGKVPPSIPPMSFPPGDWVPKPSPKGPTGIDPPIKPPDDKTPPEVVPEPASLLFGLIGVAAMGLAHAQRRRRPHQTQQLDLKASQKNRNLSD